VLAGNYNFTIDQGAHFERVVTIKNPDDSLYDLTNHTARMQIRTEIDSEVVVLELTTENGRIVLGGNLGTITLIIDSSDTENISTDGVYDIEIIDDSDRVFRVLKGKIRLEPEVTRD
jgi:hypothetical protein